MNPIPQTYQKYFQSEEGQHTWCYPSSQPFTANKIQKSFLFIWNLAAYDLLQKSVQYSPYLRTWGNTGGDHVPAIYR